jgi:hypothetical protein
MMTLRRYLTSTYDWTGLSARLYRSKGWEFGALFAVGAFMLLLIMLFHGPMVTDQVRLNLFAPPTLVHTFDLILAGVLMFFLLTNAFRMYWLTMHPGSGTGIVDIIRGVTRDGPGYLMHQGEKIRVPLRLYVSEAATLVTHAVTQKQFLECTDLVARWVKHLLLVSGYVIMFFLVVFFLMWFQTDNIYALYHPQRWLGYYATAVLIYGTVEILVGRIRKREHMHKHSDFSDWMFPILLLLTALSGILVHIFRYQELPLATYYTYSIHLMIAVPMLAVEVPFGKWAHLLYRPLASYLQAVKDRALEMQLAREDTVAHAA